MARQALRFGRHFRILMRIMAVQAGELAFALQKTGALAEVHRLMPHVPGILEIRSHALGRRHPMTLPALVVHLRRRQPPRILNILARRCRRVICPCPVARFTTHSGFGRLNRPRCVDSRLPRRMALKAPQNIRVRRERLVGHALWTLMARSQSQPARLLVPRLTVL